MVGEGVRSAVVSSAPVVHLHEVLPEDEGPRTGPRLSVLVSLNFPDLNDHVADLVRALTKVALQEAASLGFDWRIVDTSEDLPDVAAALDTDAVLILGGGDVDSELYGVPGPVPHEYGVDVAADHFTIDAIRAAVAADVPVLAVCRGVQLLNVAYGGTLVPDLDPSHLHHGDHESGLFLDEHVRIDEGTRLLEILGERDWHVRNGHHQAVDVVAPGLRRAAVADDGIVEAVEHPTAWAIGVQWHPEESDGPGDDRELLWRALRDAADERLRRR